jgi:hypothetical protein
VKERSCFELGFFPKEQKGWGAKRMRLSFWSAVTSYAVSRNWAWLIIKNCLRFQYIK